LHFILSNMRFAKLPTLPSLSRLISLFGAGIGSDHLLDKCRLLLLDAVVAIVSLATNIVEALHLLALFGSRLLLWLLLWNEVRISANGLVSLFVHRFDHVSRNAELDVLRELALVSVIVIALESTHVCGDVLAKDAVTMCLAIVALLFLVVTWEALGGVRNVETSIEGALEHGKLFCTCCCPLDTNVQAAAESSW